MNGTARVALLLARHEDPQFAPAAAWLAQRTRLLTSTDTDQAHRLCRTKQPELIVVAQSHPGQFSAGEVELLYRAAPLARMVALLGSWCEGEARSGHPWPGVARLYWHQFVPYMEQLWRRTGLPGSSAPRTSAEADRFLEASSAASSVTSLDVVIGGGDRSACEALYWALTRAGHAPRYDDITRAAPAVAVWDCAASLDEELAPLTDFAQRLAPARVVALAGFPRLSEVEAARRIGVHQVLAKPYMLNDLLFALEA